MRKIYLAITIVLMLTSTLAMAQEKGRYLSEWNNSSSQNMRSKDNKAYNYQEHDGIVVYYETKNKNLYRELLPKEFDMPHRLLVHLFIMDFYKIDSEAEPYKEMSISLLGKHNGKDIWHCIFMPVTSRHSMIAGQRGLGLPKTMGEVSFIRDNFVFTGQITDNQNRSAQFILDTKNYKFSKTDEENIKNLNAIPKISLLNGKPTQMTRSGRQGNIIDASKRYPRLLKVQGGQTTVLFDNANMAGKHPFDLEPSHLIVSYYILNKIPFRLGRK